MHKILTLTEKLRAFYSWGVFFNGVMFTVQTHYEAGPTPKSSWEVLTGFNGKGRERRENLKVRWVGR